MLIIYRGGVFFGGGQGNTEIDYSSVEQNNFSSASRPCLSELHKCPCWTHTEIRFKSNCFIVLLFQGINAKAK